MPLEKLTGVKKAAVLLICLGEDCASKILEELNDDEAYMLSCAMANIDHIPRSVQEQIAQDFAMSRQRFAGIVIKGHEFAQKTIAGSGNKQQVEPLISKFVADAEQCPLQLIANISPNILAGLLEHEHPQTVALILSTQSPEHASAIISRMPAEKQADIIYRIATTEQVTSAVIDRIEEALNKQIGPIGDQECQRLGGLDKAVEILNKMDGNLDADILQNMDEIDPDMVENIRKQMFTFEDLSALDDHSLQMILREINNESLTMSLKTASADLKEKIFANLSPRAAETISCDLETMSPVRLSEVQAMQQTIVKIAMNLEEVGKLVLRKGDRDVFV